MQVCIVGAGAIGGWLAARMASADADVSVLARRETLQRIDTEGLLLTEGGTTRCVAVTAAEDPSRLGVQDLLVIAVKAPALPALAPLLAPLIAPETMIVPMLNGVPWWFTEEPLDAIDPDGEIADALPIEQVIGCVVHASAFRSARNHVTVKHADRLIVGEPDGAASQRIERLAALFRSAGLRTDASDSIRRAIWYKLWGNATINPLSALTRSTADKLLQDPAIRAFMAGAMDELAAIGGAIDCPIEQSAEDRMAVTERLGAFRSSMLQDVEAGRPIELGALLGAPREIAHRVGIATPQLDRIHAMTRLLAQNLGLLP